MDKIGKKITNSDILHVTICNVFKQKRCVTQFAAGWSDSRAEISHLRSLSAKVLASQIPIPRTMRIGKVKVRLYSHFL